MEMGSANMVGIADLVAKAFLDLKQDMDKIIVQNTVSSSASPTKQALENSAGQLSALPALQLHGRTVSETPGYDDYVLPNPIFKLPEAVPDVIDITATDFHSALQADAESAADIGAINVLRRAAVGTGESQDTIASPPAAGAPVSPAGDRIPKTEGPCRKLSQTSISEPASPPQIIGDAISPLAASSAGQTGQQDEEKPRGTSQLSYKDLLEKAMGGFDSRLAQQMQASLRKPSPDNSTGSPQRQPVVGGPEGSPSQSKFPASIQKQSAGAKPELPASPGSLRIFKQDSRSAQRLLEKIEADQRVSADDAGAEASRRRSSDDKSAGSSRRSRSAPREEAAMAAHVKRFSPPAPTAGAAEQNPTRTKSNPRGATVSSGVTSPGYIERLYEKGKEKQQKRAQVHEKRSVSPVRLSEAAWNRVSNRLYTDAQRKEQRLREKRAEQDHARQEAMHPSSGGSLSDRMHGVRRSGGASGSIGGRAPDPAFYGRQQALLERRADRARQRRPSDYLTPEEAKECTFHPEISKSSRELHRSVTDMHKWELHRKLHVMELEDEKSSHEFDGHTFMPEINDLSRKLALQHYAASPDPNRPWTTSPRHTTAPVIRPYSPARSERSRSVSPRSQHSDVAASAPANILRHSIAGPHMQYVQAVHPISTIRNSALSTAPAVHTSPPTVQPNPRLWSAPAAVAGLSKSVDAGASLLAHARQQQQQAATLAPGVVMGIPVAAAGTALPEDAVVIQVPVGGSGGGGGSTQGPLLCPVAPGDGVAFISLGPIRTAGPAAAAAAGSTREVQVLSPVQAQMGLEQGLGSGDWARATAAAVRGDDSAANTPIVRGMSGAVPARMLRAFRDDSAGGVYAPIAKTISSGGAYFNPVVSAHKADIHMKQKQLIGAGGQQPGLQPTLSDATRAALELSQYGLRDVGSQAAGYAAAARQQAVPAYYMAVDSREVPLKGSNSYSQRYNYTKGTKSADGAEHLYSGGVTDAVTASKEAAMHEWQQQQAQQQHQYESAAAGVIQRAPSLQKYSTAQLLNARNRISAGGVAPVTTAMPLSPTAAAAGTAPREQGQVLTQMASTQLLPGNDSALDAALQGAHISQLEQLAAQVRAEGLLSETQSVPYELMVEPRSRLVLSSSKDGSGTPAQQMLTLLGRTEDGSMELGQAAAEPAAPTQQQQRSSGGNAEAAAAHTLSGSYTVNHSSTTTTVTGRSSQSLVQSLLRPVAASPFLPDSRDASRAGTPATSSHNLLHVGQRAAPIGGSKLSTVSKARMNLGSPNGGSSGSSPDHQQMQSTWPVEPAGATAPTAAASAAGASGSPASGDSMSAADVLGLLFSAELTPEAKARRMAELFGKTMSQHNIQLGNLQETLEAVTKAAAATPIASAAATTPTAHAPTEDTPSATRATDPASSAGPPQSKALDTSENMQELLMRVSAESNAPRSGGRDRTSGNMQPDEQAAQHQQDNGDVFLDTEEAQVDDSGPDTAVSSAGGGEPTHSRSGSGSSSGRGTCRITQFAAVAKQSDQ